MPSYLTFADLVDNVIQYSGSDPSTQKVQLARRAALTAYSNMGKHQEWSFFKRMFSIPVAGPYSTGTVTYDHTGGAYERVLTLAGGTWPTWATYGYVILDEATYQVSARRSATELQLAEFNNPGADVAALTEYDLIRDAYPLPPDFSTAYSAVTQPGGISLGFVTVAQWAYGRDFVLASGRPLQYTITGDVNVPQRKMVKFWPGSDASYSVLFTYRASLVEPTYLRESTGTVSLTASSVTATGSGTAWESGMAGAVLRVGRDGKVLPTGNLGDAPAAAEYLITSVESATSLTLSSAASATVDRRAQVVSSLLDVDPQVHQEFLLRETERQYRASARVVPIAGEQQLWQETLNRARDADAMYSGWKGCSPWQPILTIYDIGPVPA